MMLRTIGVFTLIFATLAWTWFVTWYAIRSKWWKNPYGRNTMGTSAGILALLLVFSAQVIFKRYPGYEIVWSIVFLNLGVLGIQRTFYMEKAQREMRRKSMVD